MGAASGAGGSGSARARMPGAPPHLAHEPRLQCHVVVAHVALNLGARHERGDAVDDDDVHRAGAHERVDDLERLLAAVGL